MTNGNSNGTVNFKRKRRRGYRELEGMLQKKMESPRKGGEKKSSFHETRAAMAHHSSGTGPTMEEEVKTPRRSTRQSQEERQDNHRKERRGASEGILQVSNSKRNRRYGSFCPKVKKASARQGEHLYKTDAESWGGS